MQPTITIDMISQASHLGMHGFSTAFIQSFSCHGLCFEGQIPMLPKRLGEGLLREAKPGGLQTRSFPLFSGKVQIVSRTLSGLFLVGALNRPRQRKGTNRENPGPSASKSGKSRKNRESPKKDKKGQKRTKKDKEGQKRKDKSRSGNPPV